MKNWLKLGFLIKKKLAAEKVKELSLPSRIIPCLKLLKVQSKKIWLLTGCMLTMKSKNLCSPGPLVLVGGARKLSSYLVGAKVYPLERKVGSCGCE